MKRALSTSNGIVATEEGPLLQLPEDVWKKCLVEYCSETTWHIVRFTCKTLHQILHRANCHDRLHFTTSRLFYWLTEDTSQSSTLIDWVMTQWPCIFNTSYANALVIIQGRISILNIIKKHNLFCPSCAKETLWHVALQKGNIDTLN